jgi:hypothetical protein
MKTKSDKKQDEPVKRLAVKNALKVMKPKQKPKSITSQLNLLLDSRNFESWIKGRSRLEREKGELVRTNLKFIASRRYVYRGPNAEALNHAQAVLDLSVPETPKTPQEQAKRVLFYYTKAMAT